MCGAVGSAAAVASSPCTLSQQQQRAAIYIRVFFSLLSILYTAAAPRLPAAREEEEEEGRWNEKNENDEREKEREKIKIRIIYELPVIPRAFTASLIYAAGHVFFSALVCCWKYKGYNALFQFDPCAECNDIGLNIEYFQSCAFVRI